MNKIDVFDKMTGHVAVARLPGDMADLVQDGYGTMPHRPASKCRGCGCDSPRFVLCESCSGDWQQHGLSSPEEEWNDQSAAPSACATCSGTGQCSLDCTGDGRCLCGGAGCPECGS